MLSKQPPNPGLHPSPEPSLVREHLQRVLASRYFANSPRTSRFLSFIVDKHLCRPNEPISAYEIGTDVFDLDPKSFDPNVDTDVRTGATRLRRTLAKYYASEDSPDRIRIEVPPGGFRPAFLRVPSGSQADAIQVLETNASAGPAIGKQRWPRWSLVAVAGILTGVLLAGTLNPVPLPKQCGVAVLPFTAIGNDPRLLDYSNGLLMAFTSKLSEKKNLRDTFWAVPASEILLSGVQSASEARHEFGVDLVISGSLERMGEQVRMTATVQDARTLRQLRSKTITIGLTERFEMQDQLIVVVIEVLETKSAFLFTSAQNLSELAFASQWISD